MASQSNTAPFLLFHRAKDGEPQYIFPHKEDVGTYLGASINICREMLLDETVVAAFGKMALDFAQTETAVLYSARSELGVVNVFIDKIRERFPLVFVDDSMRNPDDLAGTYRRKYDGDFDTRNHAFILNGPRVEDMCYAGRLAARKEAVDKDRHRFQVFLFTTAITLLHELGHLFITFLSRGKSNTPPHMSTHVADNEGNFKPEAGFTLEIMVFGGPITVRKDPAEHVCQSGVPHLFLQTGIRLISQDAINNLVNYSFDFPLRVEGLMIDGSTRPTLGAGIPEAIPPGDPLKRPETQALIDVHNAYPDAWDHTAVLLNSRPKPQRLSVGPDSALRRVATDPSLRAKLVE